MPSCTPPCLLFRPCRNLSDYGGFFPTMSHLQGGIFPTMLEFFPQCRNFSQFPSYMPRKIPSLLMEWIPVYLMQKNAVGGSKNIPLNPSYVQ